MTTKAIITAEQERNEMWSLTFSFQKEVDSNKTCIIITKSLQFLSSTKRTPTQNVRWMDTCSSSIVSKGTWSQKTVFSGETQAVNHQTMIGESLSTSCTCSKKQKQEFYEERNIGLAFQDSYLPQSRQWGYILNFFGPPFISWCSCRNCYCFSCVFQGEWFWCLVFSFVLSERQQLLQRYIKRISDHFSTQTTVMKDVTSMVLRTKTVLNEELLDISLSLSLVGGLV